MALCTLKSRRNASDKLRKNLTRHPSSVAQSPRCAGASANAETQITKNGTWWPSPRFDLLDLSFGLTLLWEGQCQCTNRQRSASSTLGLQSERLQEDPRTNKNEEPCPGRRQSDLGLGLMKTNFSFTATVEIFRAFCVGKKSVTSAGWLSRRDRIVDNPRSFCAKAHPFCARPPAGRRTPVAPLI